MQVSDYIYNKYGGVTNIFETDIDNAAMHNLLAVILRSSKIENAQQMAERTIRDYGINYLINEKDPVKLNKALHIGLHNCKQIVAMFEIGRRCINPVKQGKILIRGPEDVYNMYKFTTSHIVEQFYGVYMNTRNLVIHTEAVFKGHLTGCIAHPREFLKLAIDYGASHFIVVHNHPSGEYEPSKMDDEITKTIKESAEIMQIPLTDHIIVAENGFYSYNKEGRL